MKLEQETDTKIVLSHKNGPKNLIFGVLSILPGILFLSYIPSALSGPFPVFFLFYIGLSAAFLIPGCVLVFYLDRSNYFNFDKVTQSVTIRHHRLIGSSTETIPLKNIESIDVASLYVRGAIKTVGYRGWIIGAVFVLKGSKRPFFNFTSYISKEGLAGSSDYLLTKKVAEFLSIPLTTSGDILLKNQ